MSARTTRERGSLSLELAMLAPALLLIFGLITVYGRVAQVNGNLESSTRDAARSATRARSFAEAKVRAREVIEDGIANTPDACRNSLKVAVDQFVPGQPTTVSTTCTYPIGDVGVPGAPGTLTARSEFVAVVDDFRSVT